LQKLMLVPSLVRPYGSEDRARTKQRFEAVCAAWPDKSASLDAADLSIVRELFGGEFLTPSYFLKSMESCEV